MLDGISKEALFYIIIGILTAIVLGCATICTYRIVKSKKSIRRDNEQEDTPDKDKHGIKLTISPQVLPRWW